MSGNSCSFVFQVATANVSCSINKVNFSILTSENNVLFQAIKSKAISKEVLLLASTNT
jgi:hypothetical protein